MADTASMDHEAVEHVLSRWRPAARSALPLVLTAGLALAIALAIVVAACAQRGAEAATAGRPLALSATHLAASPPVISGNVVSVALRAKAAGPWVAALDVPPTLTAGRVRRSLNSDTVQVLGDNVRAAVFRNVQPGPHRVYLALTTSVGAVTTVAFTVANMQAAWCTAAGDAALTLTSDQVTFHPASNHAQDSNNYTTSLRNGGLIMMSDGSSLARVGATAATFVNAATATTASLVRCAPASS